VPATARKIPSHRAAKNRDTAAARMVLKGVESRLSTSQKRLILITFLDQGLCKSQIQAEKKMSVEQQLLVQEPNRTPHLLKAVSQSDRR
jgi:hypothetical protein